MREPTYNFTEYFGNSVPIKEDGYFVSVSIKTGLLTLSRKTIDAFNLNGKILRLYSDPAKNAIGWRVFSPAQYENINEETRRGMRKITMNEKTKTACLSIPKLLKSFPQLPKPNKYGSCTRLLVEEYKNPQMIEQGPTHFIRLTDQSDDISSPGVAA